MKDPYNWLKCRHCEASISTKASEVMCLNCNSYMYVLEDKELAQGIKKRKREPPKGKVSGHPVFGKDWPVSHPRNYNKDI